MDHRRGPRLARSSGLLGRDAGADPWRHAGRDGHGHEPGLAYHDWDHIAGHTFPIAKRPALSGSTSRGRGWIVPRRSSAWRSTRRSTRRGRGAPVDEQTPRNRAADRDPIASAQTGYGRPSVTPSTSCPGSHGHLARSSAVGDRAARRHDGSVTLTLRHEVLRLALRDPFHIARGDHDAGHAVTTVVVDFGTRSVPGRGRARRGLPRAVLRGDDRHDDRRSSRCWSPAAGDVDPTVEGPPRRERPSPGR